MKKLLTVGEPLSVFSSEDLNKELSESKHFTRYIAGAELNVAIGVSKLGLKVEYVTAVGDDPFGSAVLADIKSAGIGTKYVERKKNEYTGFYFKQRVQEGDPQIYYYRKNSAATKYQYDNVERIDFSEISHVHTSGIMAGISDNGYKTVSKLLSKALDKGVTTTFDPNIRAQLWNSDTQMKKVLNELALKAKIILPGINEGEKLTGLTKPEKIADFYLQQSNVTEAVIIKLGSEGAFLKTKAGKIKSIPGFAVQNVIDTVGAGDGFAAGFISGLMDKLSYEDSIERACAFGALAIQSPGDNSGYPNRLELNQFYSRSRV